MVVRSCKRKLRLGCVWLAETWGVNALTHILSKIPYEELPRAKVKFPKRQERGDYKESDYPFRLIPEVF